MEYTGINKAGFDRDARLFNEWRTCGIPSEAEIAAEARNLAHDYGIDSAVIWDMLPEYEAQA